LESCRARVHTIHPFTIRLVDYKSDDTQPLILKVDPGSRKTGVAIVREDEAKTTATVVALVELKHRARRFGIWFNRHAGPNHIGSQLLPNLINCQQHRRQTVHMLGFRLNPPDPGLTSYQDGLDPFGADTFLGACSINLAGD
jgi:hypothetical protein